MKHRFGLEAIAPRTSLLIKLLCVAVATAGGLTLTSAAPGARLAGWFSRPETAPKQARVSPWRDTAGPVAARADGRGAPWLTLEDGVEIPGDYAKAAAEPLALATADLDEDGVPDLVAGYRAESGGTLTVARGNADAIYPNAKAAQAHRADGTFTDAPYLAKTATFGLAAVPDFVVAGDFDADGHADVVTARAGANGLLFSRGDGRGNLAAATTVDLGGKVTALASGELGAADNRDELVVGVATAGGARLLVFGGGDLSSAPRTIALPGRATSLAFGQLDAGFESDLAVAAGGRLALVHGGAEGVETVETAFAVAAVAAGDFVGDRTFELALLGEDGSVRLRAADGAISAWGEPVAGAVATNGRAPVVARARVSTLPHDALVVADPASTRLSVLLGDARDGQANAPRVGPDSKAVAVDLDGAPVALATGRLNADGLTDLVVLRAGKSAPVGVVTATFTYTVDSASDSDDLSPGDGFCADEGGACTLRAAIQESNSNSGSTEIDFAIGSGPVSIALTGTLDSITDTVLIDGTTQPGFSGAPIVEVSGFGSGKGEPGFFVASGVGTVVRGFVINNWAGPGVLVGSSADLTTVEGCYIGTDAAGTTAVPNGGSGVDADSEVKVGGTAAGAGNVLSGNGGYGVYLTGGASSSNVQGNLIGTDSGGTTPIGNGAWGVRSNGASDVTVGSLSPSGGNVVSGNAGGGVQFDTDAAFCSVTGNSVGVGADGVSAIGNAGDGVQTSAGAFSADVTQNTIANNAGDGVSVTQPGTGIVIQQNRIYSNSGLGIDVGNDGVTPNDAPDSDGVVNYPVLASAEFDGKGFEVTGTLDAQPNKNYRIEFFVSGAADPTGFGEGEQYAGSTTVATDGSGHGSFQAGVGGFASPGDVMTATASPLGTTSFGPGVVEGTVPLDTSEFSAAVPIGGFPDPMADLTVGMTDDPDPVVAGQNITYTIFVQNFGDDAQNAKLSDTLPPNTTFVSFDASDSWQVMTPPVGGTGTVMAVRQNFGSNEVPDTFTLVVKVATNTPGGTVISNTATVTSDTADPDPSDNSATEDTTVSGVPPTLADLGVTKSADVSSAIPGDQVTYTITAHNSGPAAATNVAVSDAIPANTTFVSASAPVGWTVDAPAAGGTGTVTFSASSLANGGSATFTVVVQINGTAQSGTTVTNTATISEAGTSDPNPSNDSASASTTVGDRPSSDVSLTLSATPNPVAPGGTITYTIEATNEGPTAASDVVITFAVPGNTTFASATASTGGTCTTPSVGGTGTVRCTWSGTTPVDTTRTATVVVRVSPSAADGTTIVGNASVASEGLDLDLSNNSATERTSVTVEAGDNSADLSITTSSPSSSIDTGEQVSYTITVSNAGPSTAENVVVAGSTPTGTRLVSISPSQGTVSGTPAGEQGSFRVALGDIPAGGRATITIVVNVVAPGGVMFSNTVVVSSDTNDPGAGNNSATSSTTTVVAGNDTRLTWDPPIPCDDDCLNPPLHLQTTTVDGGTSSATTVPFFTGTRQQILRNTVIGYNIYRSNQPDVQPTPANYFTSVPASTTTIVAATAPDGSFFTVTAMYPNGESDDTNAASGGLPEPTITSFRINGNAVIIEGTGFTDAVQVFVDGIPFGKAAKVKRGNTRINQKGKLITGQKVSAYLQQQGGVILVSVLNTDQGIGTFLYRR